MVVKKKTRSRQTVKPSLPMVEISELKTKMQAILFSIVDGIVMTDFDGNILVINDLAKKMLGIEKRYPYPNKFLEYITNESVRSVLSTVLKSKDKTTSVEISFPRDHGATAIKVTKNLVTTAQGEVLGRVITLRDITLEKQLEIMKEDFLHSITHDLKSPLTSVQGYLDLFIGGEMGPITSEQKHYMEVMDLATKKLLKLILNILDMAKLEAGELKLSEGNWDIVEAACHVLESLRATVKLNNIHLSGKIRFVQGDQKISMDLCPRGSVGPVKESPKIFLFVDGDLLERVLNNLLDNAVKYTPPEGHIQLLIEDLDDRVYVHIEDSGSGIPENFLDKVFEKFRQVPGARGGTGLGLTITKWIVEAHGGKISVKSQVKRGTTFSFWIPKRKIG